MKAKNFDIPVLQNCSISSHNADSRRVSHILFFLPTGYDTWYGREKWLGKSAYRLTRTASTLNTARIKQDRTENGRIKWNLSRTWTDFAVTEVTHTHTHTDGPSHSNKCTPTVKMTMKNTTCSLNEITRLIWVCIFFTLTVKSTHSPVP